MRALADKNYALLKENPQHPSLKLKKVGRFWSVRVGLRYRALAVDVDGGLLWFWIGSHTDYDALIRWPRSSPPMPAAKHNETYPSSFSFARNGLRKK